MASSARQAPADRGRALRGSGRRVLDRLGARLTDTARWRLIAITHGFAAGSTIAWVAAEVVSNLKVLQ